MSVLLLSSDLMFGSRIRAAARDLQIDCRIASLTSLNTEITDEFSSLLLVDLTNVMWEPLTDLLNQLEAKHAERPFVVAYGPHVDHQLLENAREKGCDQVLTKGEFNQRLRELLIENCRS